MALNYTLYEGLIHLIFEATAFFVAFHYFFDLIAMGMRIIQQ